MKIKNLILFFISAVVLAGCVRGPYLMQPVSPAKYTQHKVLFEVQYDLTCKAFVNWVFKKGQRFEAVNFHNEKLVEINAFTKATALTDLPKNSLGLKLFQEEKFGTVMNITYALIFPDGNFASNYHMVVYYNGRPDLTPYYDVLNVCKIKDQSPLFKRVLIKNK